MDIYALQLIRHLQQIDNKNKYYIFVRPGEDICLQDTKNFKIVPIEAISYADWEQIWLPISVTRYKLDLLHCTSNTAPLFCSVPTMVTLHDIIYLNQSFAGGSIYQNLGHYYRKWMVPKVYRKATKVLTVSEFEAGTIKDHFRELSTNKIEVSYNGLNPKFNQKYEPEEISKVRQAHDLPENYILFLGNTAPKKNMKRVLEAYAKYALNNHHQLPLVIVESDPLLVSQLMSEIGICMNLVKVHCLEYVSNDRLPIIYQEATLFLYPSVRESFGIPILEAMASGTPVITSNTSSMPEVGQGAACYVDPLSTDMIAEEMGTLLKDKHRLMVMKKQGYERANQFSWTHTARMVLDCYRETCFRSVKQSKAFDNQTSKLSHQKSSFAEL